MIELHSVAGTTHDRIPNWQGSVSG
jgi:hypothetical protein